MDASAIALMRDNKMPLIVFSLDEPGGFKGILNGEGTYTKVTELVLLKTAKTKTRVMILEVREGAAVLEFQIPPGLEGQVPRWVAQVPWPAGVRGLVLLGHFVHTALSRCSLSMMAFSLCILVQSRLSAVRPLPCLAFWL